MKRTPAQVEDLSPFANAVHLFSTKDAVVEYNIAQLHNINRPIATIKAMHTGQPLKQCILDRMHLEYLRMMLED